jgi:hypothetical protein
MKGEHPTVSLLRVSKQVHQEAVPILYPQNTFLVDENQNLRHWLDQNGTFNIEFLKSISIVLQDFKGHQYWCLSAQCDRPAAVEAQSMLVWHEAL